MLKMSMSVGRAIDGLTEGLLDVGDTTTDDLLELPSRGDQRWFTVALEAGANFDFLLIAIGLRHLTSCDARAELQLQNITGLVAGSQNTIEIVLGVGGADTEASTRGDERRGGVTNDHDSNLALEHFV
jgi:hypothetical protein